LDQWYGQQVYYHPSQPH